MAGNQSTCNCNSGGHLAEMKQLNVEHSQQVIQSRSVASMPFTRRHARQTVQLSHRLIANAEIMHLYKTKVSLPSSYFNKFLHQGMHDLPHIDFCSDWGICFIPHSRAWPAGESVGEGGESGRPPRRMPANITPLLKADERAG
eukprot:EG_transcript_34398